MFLLVIVRPNSSFATIRDNADRYFWWSVGGFGLTIVLAAMLNVLAFSDSFIREGLLTMFFLIFLPILWYIGRWRHGNRDWRAVFSVLFYVWTPVSILATIGYILIFIPISVMYELLPLHALYIVIVYAFFLLGVWIWSFILGIKAIKVVNDWGTRKAIIVGIIGILITACVALPPIFWLEGQLGFLVEEFPFCYTDPYKPICQDKFDVDIQQ